MKKLLIATIFVVFGNILFAQVELVPPSHPVYDFLKRMQLLDIIDNYNSSVIPVSQQLVANYLNKIDENKAKLNNLDKTILKDFLVEFEFDVNNSVKSSYSLLKKFDFNDIFSDKKQKYLYNYIDSNASFFLDINGFVSQRNSNGDSLGTHSISLGELGIRARGTLFNSVGFYLRMSNGQIIKKGSQEDIDMSIITNPKLKANTKYRYENNNFDTYEGYIKYSTKNEWLSITAGKEALLTGFGYIDKLFLSDNSVPFSFIKIDLKYKSLRYYALYGSLKGDSLGKDISSKNIASHRLDIDFSKVFKLGFFESIIISESPFNFTFLNPLSFLRSADYNAGELVGGNKNNAIMGFDMELHPIKTLSFQGSLLIDDLNFSSIFDNKKNGGLANDNRFAYQIGSMWTDVFTLPGVTATIEYTRINPFVYSHRTNKSQYTNWSLPLGHNLSPNSDEIAVRLSSYIYSRLNVKLIYQHQRSAGRIILHGDTLIENYGGDINRGDGDVVRENTFLSGDRVNRDIFTFDFIWQPIRQYFLEFKYQYKITDIIYLSKKFKDIYFFLTARVDF